MRTSIVFTLTGTDRVGIVEEVTGLLLELDGNVEASRMARLGGEFAMLVLLTMPASRLSELDEAFAHLLEQGYRITSVQTTLAPMETHPESRVYRIEVVGADHEGIIHEIARGLSQAGINIESMETGTVRAPITGAPLFTMTATVVAPPSLADETWIAALREAGLAAGVDVEVTVPS